MSNILLFSDIHINTHKKSMERLEDCLNTFEWIFKTAQERNINNILFLGDLFQEKHNINVLVYQRTYEIIKKYVSDDLKFYMLLGNHDMWHSYKWNVSSLAPFSSIPGVIFINSPRTINISNYPVSFLPYTANPIEDLKSLDNKNDYKILCGHCAIDGALYNTVASTHAEVSIEHDGDVVKIGSDIFKQWDQVFLGHYHTEQKMNYNIEYVGSPLQLNFGEAFTHKHVIIYNLENHSKEYIRNTFSPQHYIIPQKDLDKYEIKNNFIRVMVDDISKADVIDVRNSVLQQGPGSLEMRQVEKFDDKNVVKDAKAILLKEDEMLEKYIQMQELDGLDKDRLLQIGKVITE